MIIKKTEQKAKQDTGVLWTLTTQEVDRTGDIVVSTGMQKPNTHIPVKFNHGYGSSAGSVPIGKIDKKNLTVNNKSVDGLVEFDKNDEFAQLIERKVNDNILTTGSIGFNPLSWDEIKNDQNRTTGYKYNSWELLEFSIVPVPANRSALKKELDFISKAFGSLGVVNEETDWTKEYESLLFGVLLLSNNEKSIKESMSRLFESKRIENKELAYTLLKSRYAEFCIDCPDFKNYTPDDLIDLDSKGLIIYAPERKSFKFDPDQAAVTIRNLVFQINEELTETQIKLLSDAKEQIVKLTDNSEAEILKQLRTLSQVF